MICTHFDHCIHVALRSGELCGIFDFYQNDEIQIVPHVVFALDMLFEAYRFVVESRPIESYKVQCTFFYNTNKFDVFLVKKNIN